MELQQSKNNKVDEKTYCHPQHHDEDADNSNNKWTIFVCNTYLIPPKYCDHLTVSCTHQRERAAMLGRMIRKHAPDVVLLQEMWGAGYKDLEDSLQPKGLGRLTEQCRKELEDMIIQLRRREDEEKEEKEGQKTNSKRGTAPLDNRRLHQHLIPMLERLEREHKMSAEPYGISQPDGRDEEEAAARIAADPTYKERLERDCKSYYEFPTFASDDMKPDRHRSSSSFRGDGEGLGLTKDETNKEGTQNQEDGRKGGEGGAASGRTLALCLSRLPPQYLIPAMMRSWWGVESLDVVVQYFSRRGGLTYAVNTNTTRLVGGRTFTTGCENLSHLSSEPQQKNNKINGGWLIKKLRHWGVLDGYWPLLAEIKERGLLEKAGCESLIEAVAVKEELPSKANVKGEEREKQGLSFKLRNALQEILPLYPRHHRFITTHYPSHNKSVMAIKLEKRSRHHSQLHQPFSSSTSSSSSSSSSPQRAARALPLLVFNTHLDPLNLGPKNRIIERQLVELKAFICDVIAKEHELGYGAGAQHQIGGGSNSLKRSDTTTSQPTALQSNVPTSQSSLLLHVDVGAVIAGDFNIPAHDGFLWDRLFEIMSNGEMSVTLVDGGEGADPSKVVKGKEEKEGEKGKIEEGSANGSGRGMSSRARVVKTVVNLRVLLPPSSLAVHTYCSHNTYVQHPHDEGRLDHIFGIDSVTIMYAAEEEGKAEGKGHNDNNESQTAAAVRTREVTYALRPVELTYERVLNDHAGGDALVSDHYPFIADIVVS